MRAGGFAIKEEDIGSDPLMFVCTHELRGGDGDVPDLAPSHEYRVDGAVRLPEVHLEGVRRRREEALVGRVERDAPVNNGGLNEHACLKTSR